MAGGQLTKCVLARHVVPSGLGVRRVGVLERLLAEDGGEGRSHDDALDVRTARECGLEDAGGPLHRRYDEFVRIVGVEVQGRSGVRDGVDIFDIVVKRS